MNIEQVNFLFLTKHCKPIGIKDGYLAYMYKPWPAKEIAIEITVKEKEFNLRFIDQIGNGLLAYKGEQQQIDNKEYLSRKIHAFL